MDTQLQMNESLDRIAANLVDDVLNGARRLAAWMISAVAVIGLLCAATLHAPVANADSDNVSLDGMTFIGELQVLGKDGGPVPDDVMFENGRFVSTVCVEQGFTAFEYSTRKRGDAIEFVARADHPTQGRGEWRGVVRNGRLEAQGFWYLPNNRVNEYSISAKTL